MCLNTIDDDDDDDDVKLCFVPCETRKPKKEGQGTRECKCFDISVTEIQWNSRKMDTL